MAPQRLPMASKQSKKLRWSNSETMRMSKARHASFKKTYKSDGRPITPGFVNLVHLFPGVLIIESIVSEMIELRLLIWPPRSLERKKPRTAFIVFCLLVPRLLSSLYNIIHDCDEVYNYWEPLHFLLYGYGMQTWEYR